MSTLWTPDGERRIERQDPDPPPPTPSSTSASPAASEFSDPQADPEALARQLAEVQAQLANTPVEVVVANHAYGLFELAALHLSASPPNLSSARLAVDAMAALLDGLSGRLGEPEETLREALSQVRLAYVHLSRDGGGPPTNGSQ